MEYEKSTLTWQVDLVNSPGWGVNPQVSRTYTQKKLVCRELRSIQIQFLKSGKNFLRLSYPPLKQKGESRAICPTRQDWFQIREQRLRHVRIWEQRMCCIICFL
jgi:hypothetical protein